MDLTTTDPRPIHTAAPRRREHTLLEAVTDPVRTRRPGYASGSSAPRPAPVGDLVWARTRPNHPQPTPDAGKCQAPTGTVSRRYRNRARQSVSHLPEPDGQACTGTAQSMCQCVIAREALLIAENDPSPAWRSFWTKRQPERCHRSQRTLPCSRNGLGTAAWSRLEGLA